MSGKLNSFCWPASGGSELPVGLNVVCGTRDGHPQRIARPSAHGRHLLGCSVAAAFSLCFLFHKYFHLFKIDIIHFLKIDFEIYVGIFLIVNNYVKLNYLLSIKKC